MRKKILVGVLVLILVVGVFGMPKLVGETKKGSSTADKSDNTIELNDGYRVKKEFISFFIKSEIGPYDKKTETGWKIENNKFEYYKKGTKYSGGDLDEQDIWRKDVGVDKHGNLYDGAGNLHSDNGQVTIPKNEIPGTLDGKVTSVGGLPAVPLKNNQYFIDGGMGQTIVLDKKTYDTLKSNAPPKGITLSGGKIEWTSKGKNYLIFSDSGGTTGIRMTYTKFAGKEETTWTTVDGKTYKESDGWDSITGGIENKEKKIKITSSEVGGGYKKGGKTTQTKTNTKTGEKEIVIKTKKGESHKKEVKGKLQSWKVWDDKGNLVGSADVEDGKVKQFNQYINGKLAGVCYGSDCDGDSEGDNIIWVTNDKFCTGKKSDCFDEKGNRKGSWSDEDDCDGKECDAIDYKEKDSFLNFEGGFWDIALGKTETQKMIGSVLKTWKPGWQGLSSWWLPDVTKEWRRAASEAFDKVLLADYVVPAAVCNYDELHRSKVPGESAVFIEVAPGIVQFVGSIQAEKSKELTPMLCSPENKTCPTGLVCEKNFCYEDEDSKTPEFGYFYKITWGVTAPQDEKHTPYKDENGIAIKFNLQFTGENWWLYNSNGVGSKNTIELKNGARDGGAITHYSVKDFKEVCIHFGAPPRDVSGGEVTSPICADFVESNVGKIEYETSDEGTSTTTTSGTVSYNSNW